MASATDVGDREVLGFDGGYRTSAYMHHGEVRVRGERNSTGELGDEITHGLLSVVTAEKNGLTEWSHQSARARRPRTSEGGWVG